MDRIEYLKELQLLKDDFDLKASALLTKYALSNAKFKIGDRIKNYREIEIAVEEIKYFLPFEYSDPVIVYKGTSIEKFGRKSVATIDERDIIS